MNCVSYEIAVKLKAAGFPEPHQLMSSDIEVWAYCMSYTAKITRLHFVKKYDYLFAPTISDILPLMDADVFYSKVNKCFTADTQRTNGMIFQSVNIHDAAALAWLHQNASK